MLGICIALSFNAQAALLKPKARVMVLDSAVVYQAAFDFINNSFYYQQRHVLLPGDVSELTVPQGFRYLDSAQASRVRHRLWHNPP